MILTSCHQHNLEKNSLYFHLTRQTYLIIAFTHTECISFTHRWMIWPIGFFVLFCLGFCWFVSSLSASACCKSSKLRTRNIPLPRFLPVGLHIHISFSANQRQAKYYNQWETESVWKSINVKIRNTCTNVETILRLKNNMEKNVPEWTKPCVLHFSSSAATGLSYVNSLKIFILYKSIYHVL